jgi:septum formation protein
MAEPPVVLASGSVTRARMLADAGVVVLAEAAAVDEAEVRAGLRAERATAAQAAETLAELKALRVARRHPGALVIGADQMLDCNGVWFDKPVDRVQARAQLQALRGRPHELISAVCVVRDGARIWHADDRARLTMRNFSDGFLDEYLAREGDGVLGSVGAYRLEGLGVQLFQRVEGDFFTVLGLPLLALLDFLRGHRVINQ